MVYGVVVPRRTSHCRTSQGRAVRIIYEDELLGDSDEEQQQAHVDIPQQPQVMILWS